MLHCSAHVMLGEQPALPMGPFSDHRCRPLCVRSVLPTTHPVSTCEQLDSVWPFEALHDLHYPIHERCDVGMLPAFKEAPRLRDPPFGRRDRIQVENSSGTVTKPDCVTALH